ncbi:MAG: M14 family metallopeptidase [Candidatus Pacebacteria bacterium]|jgi:hypothetical protein|nr:M14 family metallopeptidase [Candidatus Paceibacterota bacterium]
MKKIVIAVCALLVAGIGFAYFYLMNNQGVETGPQDKGAQTQPQNQNNAPKSETPVATTSAPESDQPAESEPTAVPDNKTETIIGKSAGGRDIVAYHLGNLGGGDTEVLLIGGIHGGYSWNTSLLAYQLMGNYRAAYGAIPPGGKLTVIPVLNPDGLAKVVSVTGPFKASDVTGAADVRVAGRFNANNVDLNRNFDCNWKAAAVWQNKTVSGGTAAFSEPEAQAIKNYAQNKKIAAVIAWYSSGGGVYLSSCNGVILPATQTLADTYAKASGYTAYKNFESYQVSGDMTDWFSKNGVPAIGVLLTTAADTEYEKNEAGVWAVLNHYFTK